MLSGAGPDSGYQNDKARIMRALSYREFMVPERGIEPPTY